MTINPSITKKIISAIIIISVILSKTTSAQTGLELYKPVNETPRATTYARKRKIK
ncbi:hypothetical protein QFZ48_001980 [Chitinophaga sp. W2I13]